MRPVTGGQTDVTEYFQMRLLTGGDANSLTVTDFDLTYTRSGKTSAAKVDATALAQADSPHADNKMIEVSPTNAPALYRVDWPDAAFAAGEKIVVLTVRHTLCFTESLRVVIDAEVNVTSADGLGAATGGAFSIEPVGDNTTQDTIDNAVAVDKGGGLVGIPVTGHAFTVGREVTITGTANYDGSYELISQTTDEVVITASYVGETFSISDTINSSVKGIEFVGTITSGTYLDTANKSGTTHDMDDDSNVIDIVYIYNVGGGRVGTALSLIANLNGNTDELAVQTYNNVTDAWETIESLPGSGGSSFQVLVPDLLRRHTGTNAELGDVFIRFATATTSPSSLEVDKLTVSVVNIGQSSGYLGFIWLDTVEGVAGTEPFVNGVSDGAVDTIGDANTLSASVGLQDYHILNGSDFEFVASQDNTSFFGDNWTLALGGQSISGIYIQGAIITGVGTATSEIHMQGCDIGTASLQLAHCDKCGFSGTVTQTLAGEYKYHNCYSEGSTPPVFTKTAGQTVAIEFQNWAGDITINGLEAGDTVELGGLVGNVVLNGANATVHIHGHYETLEDNLTGAPTVEVTGAIQTQDVADILEDTNELQTDDIPGAIAGLEDLSAAEVNAEVVDVLKTDVITLPGQEAPPLTPTFEEAVSWLYKVFRNRKTQTATEWNLLADDESTVDAKATVSSDGTTAVKQEIESGP